MNDLQLIGQKHGTDKSLYGYLNVYYNFFLPLKNKKINLLEIGVYNGSSFKVWNEFFTNANLIGFDIEDKENILKIINENIIFFLGDQGNENHLEILNLKVKNLTNRYYDIVIDDGSHLQYDLMYSFGKLFPYLNSGGIYILEDLCTIENLSLGHEWWGNENHTNSWMSGFNILTSLNKNWLPNGKKNLFYSAEATMERFKNTGIFDSAFLGIEENKYINENTEKVFFFKANIDPIIGTSSMAVVIKK